MAPKHVARSMICKAIAVMVFAGTLLYVPGAFAGNLATSTPEGQKSYQDTMPPPSSMTLPKPDEIRPYLAGTWRSYHAAEFACETVYAEGTAEVSVGSRPDEYVATSTNRYRRTLKPGCHFVKPGMRQEFTTRGSSTWQLTGDRTSGWRVISTPRTGDDERDTTELTLVYKLNAGTLVTEFMWDDGKQEWRLYQQ